MNIDEKIQFFFEHPGHYRETGRFSYLYLLRREISMCFGEDPNDGKKINYSAIWPGTMAILAGIDLLGKFYAGDDSGRGNPQKGVGARFKSFTEKYLIQSKTDAETLYQLRNSLLHSFGLYSKTSKGEYRFILTRGSRQFITNTNEGQYVIDVSILWNKFEEEIKSYFQELYQVHELQKKFEMMFCNYGVARIG